MAILSDFLAAVNQIAAERGIESEEVIEAIEMAIRTGYKKNYGTGESLDVEINKDSGEVNVYADKKVVKKVTDKATQIALKDARMIEPKLKAGDHIKVDVTPEGDFGRIAVQAAKQVILQKVREAEKESMMKDFKDKVGTIESGIIQRMDGENVIVEIQKAQATMPKEERLPGEYYRSGARLKFLLQKIQRTASGKQLLVSRADSKFLEELFAIEVPEIRSGSVEIMGIAREAGSRSKVAVKSNQEGVDPIGACVGQKGIRIDNITDELQGEKIDIILWDDDVNTYLANSLSPAQVSKIDTDKKEKSALVVVPDDQLSLAIGKDGQNVRLAAKLTGWKIDIEGETKKVEDLEKGKKKEKGEETEEGEEEAKDDENKEKKPEKKKSAKKIKEEEDKKEEDENLQQAKEEKRNARKIKEEEDAKEEKKETKAKSKAKKKTTKKTKKTTKKTKKSAKKTKKESTKKKSAKT